MLNLLYLIWLLMMNLFGFVVSCQMKKNLKDNTLSFARTCAPRVPRSEARRPRIKGAKTLYRFYVWSFFDSKYRPLSGLFELSKAKELDSLGEIYFKIRFEYCNDLLSLQ